MKQVMSNKKSDGGQAYPFQGTNTLSGEPYHVDGMTMRQSYKAKAMQGMLFGQVQMITQAEMLKGASITAETAGEIADAMIAEDEQFKADNP